MKLEEEDAAVTTLVRTSARLTIKSPPRFMPPLCITTNARHEDEVIIAFWKSIAISELAKTISAPGTSAPSRLGQQECDPLQTKLLQCLVLHKMLPRECQEMVSLSIVIEGLD